MSKYRIVSADAHILEPPGIWENWLPEKYQDRAPKLVNDAEGGDAWEFAGSTQPDPIGLVSTPGMPYDQFRWMGVTYDDARPGCYDGEERLKDMAFDGVDAEILFPPQRTVGHFLGDGDDDFVLAGIEAYNNFLFEEFCAPDPSRLVGMAQIPSLGIDAAVDGLRKGKARGAKGVIIGNWPAGGDDISEDDDAFWSAAVDEGMPVTIHILLLSRRARQAQRAAAAKAGGNRLYGGKGAAAKAKAVGGLGSVFSLVPNHISQLIFTGVFDRFPDLQVVMVETGIGWLPHFLEMMDDKYWRNRSWAELPIQSPPSDYWHRNLSATFIVDRAGIDLRDRVGIDNIMWSTDYPHHGNDWPYSRKVIEETMGQLPEEERSKIVAGNAVRLFHLDD
jgi:predicted TIM-barrel fold metal-dependent hydrolase